MSNTFIPLSVPVLEGNEWPYVKECLDTGWISTAGPFVTRFEEAICAFTGSPYATACASGTAALHVALLLAGVQPGEEVIVPTLTFIAPINAVRYVQAEPVFMDSDPYFNIDVEKTLHFIETETVYRDGQTFNKKTGRRIAAIIPVHVFGNPVDLQPLIERCQERSIFVIEDASESLGATYTTGALKGRMTGTIAPIGVYSFNGNKIISSGGGGMLVAQDAKLAEKATYLTTQAKDDAVRYVHHEIGYNYRLTNVQAALGVAQLEQLPEYIRRKKVIYESYSQKLAAIEGLHLAETPPYGMPNYWLMCLQINSSKYGIDREGVMRLLKENNIQSRPVWYPNHLQTPYKECQSYCIELAEELCSHTLNIPCSVNLTQDDISHVIKVLKITDL
ncbi:MAG: LegC family aminotransferase [Rhodothermaceae bacterium]|nr:LegC family aminotransferase [Rhodothermaceae bacterium]